MAEFDDSCKSTTGPKFKTPSSTNQNGCIEPLSPTEAICPPVNPQKPDCKLWQFTLSEDACFMDGINNEAIAIAGANFNVYRLLGVHEQSKLQDATGKGDGISGGALTGFPPKNAFDIFNTQWQSLQTGSANIIASSFIGYDFGEIKTNSGNRNRYSVHTACRRHITAFTIKQSSNPNARVTKARLERSEDGMKWYGVQVVNLPDDDCLNTILSRGSVESRYWRLRPIEFTGGVTNRWGVTALQMHHNYDPTYHDNIQDKIFLENRNRDYDGEPITLKGTYDLFDTQTELTRFGIELPSQTINATFNFQSTVAALGRPIIIGDIIQLPSETQYSAELTPIEKWLEVTDVSWASEGFTPGWQSTLVRAVLQPAYVSEETQDLFGDMAEVEVPDGLGLIYDNDGHHPLYQDYSTTSQTATAESKNAVPERGTDTQGIRQFTEEELLVADQQGVNLRKYSWNPKGFQSEDAIPPNDAPYTESNELPTTGVKDGDYHRLTYDHINNNLPARLYRYSGTKGRWIYLEKDRRAQNNSAIPILEEFVNSPDRKPYNQITRDDC